MSESAKVKTIDLMVAALEPLILENGFKRIKKGTYVRLRCEILQFIFFYTYRPPCDIRFAMLPYWAVNAELISKRRYEECCHCIMDTSRIADQLDKYDDLSNRWCYNPSDTDAINSVLSLYKEKFSNHIIPYLNTVVDYNSYYQVELELLRMQRHSCIYGMPRPVLKYQCILEGNFSAIINAFDEEQNILKEEARKSAIAEPSVYRLWLSWTRESTNLSPEEKKQKMEHYEQMIVKLESRTSEDIEKQANDECQKSLHLLHKQFQEFYDAIESSASPEIFADEITTLRAQMKDVIKQCLKLQV